MALENACIPSWNLLEQWITRAQGKGKLGGPVLVPIIPEKSWDLKLIIKGRYRVDIWIALSSGASFTSNDVVTE